MKKTIIAFILVVACSSCLFLLPQIACSEKATTKDSLTNGASVFKKVSPSIVVVRCISNISEIQGSGVAYGYGSTDLKTLKPNVTWVVTNAHVVTGCNTVKVVTKRKTYLAEIQYADPEIDIALLMVRDVVIPITKEAGADVVTVGDRVFAIGSPLGLENSITEGIVSGIREMNGVKLIQTSAAISKGSSGGGLFDGNGHFVGITTFKITSGESLNFAIDAQYIDTVSKAYGAAICISIGKYKNEKDLMSSALIKWLLKKQSPDGDPMYLYVNRISDELLKTKDSDLFEKFYVIRQQYIAENGSVNKSSSASQPPSTVYHLACPMYFVSDGRFAHEVILEIDEANALVNGKPAQFFESTIVLQVNTFKYTLNRYTATMTASIENKPVATGKCSKVGERKF